jgi:hypothetical protein
MALELSLNGLRALGLLPAGKQRMLHKKTYSTTPTVDIEPQ